MSAFQPNGALLSIGGAMLMTVGLNPQRIALSSSARFPVHPVQAGVKIQSTGLDAQRITIEAVTFPHVTGGLDSYAMLKGFHEAQAVVPYIRLRGNYLGEAGGLAAIETLDADEERLHPFDGVGRQVSVSLGLLLIPMRTALAARMAVTSIRGLFS